jgi:hypothetical protein
VVWYAFENYAVQRNFDLSLATHSWILLLDADERLTADLKEEIIKTKPQTRSSDYFCYRNFMFKNMKLYVDWWNNKTNKLFNKEKPNMI